MTEAEAKARAESAYHDPSCPPRACDRCGRSYTGPAIYCSLECAVLDSGGHDEFDCSDCDLHVIRFGGTPGFGPRRCAACQFVAEIPDETIREAVRERLRQAGEIGDPRPQRLN